MDKKVLLIDMDEVIIEKFVLHLYNEFTGENRPLESFTKQYVQDEFDDQDKKERFFDYLFTKDNVYEGVALMDGVLGIMPKLNENYTLYICSDFLVKECELRSGKFLPDKFNTLRKFFPYIHPSQYIFMKAKKLLVADIIIDDRPQNFGEYHKQRLLFTRYHNKNMTELELKEKNITRVDSWQEIGKLLL